MLMNKNPIYKRILLKLSGEVLQGKKSFGIDFNVLNNIIKSIKELIELNIQIGIVIGGGNLFRGVKLEKSGITRVVGDHIGMLSTIINGLAIRDNLHKLNINACLMSALPINEICSSYSCIKAINLINNKYVVIFSAGTGNPFFTTDSAACLRCIEINANVVLKATKVDGVFSDDPNKNKNTTLYKYIKYKDVLEKKLKIMDLTAFTLARDYNIPIIVFNINKPGTLKRIIMGYQEGTIISN
ncbi:MAG: UMP kinase [Enterobacterales bacterium]